MLGYFRFTIILKRYFLKKSSKFSQMVYGINNINSIFLFKTTLEIGTKTGGVYVRGVEVGKRNILQNLKYKIVETLTNDKIYQTKYRTNDLIYHPSKHVRY